MSGDHNQYQKPVAWTTDIEFDRDTEVIPANEKGKLGTDLIDIPLYTAPPQRGFIGLTDEEIQAFRHVIDWAAGWTYENFARAIEAKLKEKNG